MAEHASRPRYVEWQPGDPIWTDPRHDWLNDNGQVVRFLYDVFSDDSDERWRYCELTYAHCYRCYVAWEALGPDGAFCWICGAEGTPAGVYRQEAA